MEIQNNNTAGETREALRRRILAFEPSDFEALALDIFRYQAVHNPLYKQYLNTLRTEPESVLELAAIPFLPISFFKTHSIQTGVLPEAEVVFESSGTTGTQTSRHFLFDPALYKSVSEQIFIQKYGPADQFHMLALLPSYLERNNSSLVYMMQHFIGLSNSTYSGFYLKNAAEMRRTLRMPVSNPDGKRILLLGVTFALLDLAEQVSELEFLKLTGRVMVMDTGGMKGRRREMLREEVHDTLCAAFATGQIHSEYGMTELLSQSYSSGNGLFTPGKTMRILLRDIYDPFEKHTYRSGSTKTGGINVIDLANLDTCAFIETQDLGRYGHLPESFYVMGRFDNSDIRGCNLMVL